MFSNRLLELPGAITLHWLDTGSALYVKSDSAGKPTIIDFTSGQEDEVKGIQGAITSLSKVPGVQNQFVIGSYRSVAKVELVRNDRVAELKLIQEKPINAGSWSHNAPGWSADGKLFFTVHPRLSLLNLETLEQEIVPFEPMRLQTAVATPEPSQILVTGFVIGEANAAATYLYSNTDRSLSKVDKTKLLSERLIYIPPLKKQAVISDSKIAIVDDLPLEPPVALANFLDEAQQRANMRKLELAEQIEKAQAAAAVASRAGPAYDYASRTSAAPIAYATGILAESARNAQIEAIGVYQGANSNRSTDRTGDVEVRVRKSARPIVLILSSYESIRWRLIVEPGAQLNGVLVSGYKQSTVVGAGPARVLMNGSQYAYKEGSAEFAALNRNVVQQLGKPINAFQGRYEGSAFSVGG